MTPSLYVAMVPTGSDGGQAGLARGVRLVRGRLQGNSRPMHGHLIERVCAWSALALIGLGPGCGGQAMDQDLARLALVEEQARQRQDTGDDRPVLPLDTHVRLADAAGEGCAAHESLTILLDGERVVDPLYLSEGGQPAVVVGLTEGDGVSGVLVEDLGDYAPAMNHNLEAWLNRWRIEEATYPRRALVISHPHTVGRMILPGKFPQRQEEGPAVIDETLRRLGKASLTSASLDDMCDLARRDSEWPVAPACDHPHHALEPGLEPLVWGDGSVSGRVFLYTYAISPVEVDEVPFQPLETVLIVSAPPGYLVYSVCSHLPLDHSEDSPAPFHVVYRIKALMDAGELEPGPIHTLVTGTCGVIRSFEKTGGFTGQGIFDGEAFAARAAQMRDDMGLQRLFLSHCGLYRTSQHSLRLFHSVFGDGVRRAYPGACIPLTPPPVADAAEAVSP